MKSYVLLTLLLIVLFFMGNSIVHSPSIHQQKTTFVSAAITLACTACCPLQNEGDIDCSGKIDLADFEIWRKGYFAHLNDTPTVTPATSTPTPSIVPTTAPTIPPSACQRPYSVDSPWNTPIGTNPQYDPQSAQYLTSLTGSFGSDPTQYTFPVYEVTSTTPLKSVKLSNRFTVGSNNGQTITIQTGGPTVQVPIPAGAQVAVGTDAQIVIWNRQTGDEWGFWQAVADSSGNWTAVNGYKYNTNWNAAPPTLFFSKGPGLPYLAGLIRPCEITQGHIDHVIAFAYQNTATSFVYPATKSDGTGTAPPAIPEGALLQLDPALTDTQITGWGCTNACLTIAHALQKYGMLVDDTSGHPKVYPEYEGTAHWNGTITASTVSKIPLSSFKLIKMPPLQ